MSTVTLDGRRLAFCDRGLYLPAADALVVADLHVGRAAASEVAFPLGERAALVDRLRGLLDAVAPATVVFAGDLLHRFDRATGRTRETVAALLSACRAADADPVTVAGNHDAVLPDVRDGPVPRRHRLADGSLVVHGHEAPAADAPRYVVGHDHPTIEIEGQRRPCLLYGSGCYRGGDLAVLPAFTPLAPGVAVGGMDAADFGSPLVTDPDALRPVVHDPDAGETLAFPPLGEFRHLL